MQIILFFKKFGSERGGVPDPPDPPPWVRHCVLAWPSCSNALSSTLTRSPRRFELSSTLVLVWSGFVTDKHSFQPMGARVASNPYNKITESMAVFTPEDEQIVWTDKSSQTDKSSDVKTERTNFQTTLSEFLCLFVRL